MIREQNTDVPIPLIPKGPLSIDGLSDTNLMYQACLAKLIDIVGELRDKVCCCGLRKSFSNEFYFSISP